MAPLPPPLGPPVARERPYRRRAHGLYFHSSPPKVLQMNNHLAAKDNDYRSRDVIKPSNIRIWLHHKQMSKLAKVLWAGQGMRLRTETSHHPRMKRFLECVPHVMGVIKDIHQAVVDNDLDALKEKTAPPAPRVILTSKDANGLTPLHKAAGLAHTHIVEYILSVWPSLSSDADHTGKTPLHWAASAKNNTRSFNLLVQAGADETAQDNRRKAAEHYKLKPSDIDRSLLTVIPEAPRISQQGFPAYFDWAMFTLEDDSDEGSQTRMKPFLSQNNLLDAADVPSGPKDASGGDVVKSKSVHNLTNGVLTELGAGTDQQGKETNGNNGTGKEVNGDKPDDDGAGTDRPEAARATGQESVGDANEPTVEKDETVVEQNRPGTGSSADGCTDASAAPDAPNEPVNGDGHKGEIDRPDTAEGEQTTSENSVASRVASAKDAPISSAKSTSKNQAPEVDPNRESPSPVAGEDAEVSKDSLEQVPAERKDDEIEQDSLGKDIEPEEAATGSAETSVRPSSSASGKESIKADSQSRATTANSVMSNRTTVEQDDPDGNEESSRGSSATAGNAEQLQRNQDDNISEIHDEEEHNEQNESMDTTGVRSDRDELASGGRQRTSNGSSAKAPTTPGSRLRSRTDSKAENGSRVGSSTTMTGRSSGKSDNSSTASRRSSVGSRKSQHSAGGDTSTTAAGHGEANPKQNDPGEDSDVNDDSNNADVQIVSYRTPDEKTPPGTTESSAVVNKSDSVEQTDLGHREEKQDAAVVDPENASNIGSTAERYSATVSQDAPNQELKIEGMVQGEPDNGQLQSQNQQRIDLEEQPNMQQTAQEAIDAADLEQLASIVLNGEGKQLVGKTSKQTEIQAFLDNVSAYMGKIRRVHLAAREGSLRDLQSALDRRKFATAKDEISPHGATPLHVATIFGHAGIVRYLAGRFPETLGATDEDGRTPLHYAATVKDNGHFYNLLTHLGANPKVEDNFNHSPEYYLGHVQSQDILSHRQLLRDYGAKEELADEMLNDQELGEQQMEIPLFRTEEGRYLATSLGDPLIKGLTEVANKRPSDPVTYLANYLYNFANQKPKTGRKEAENDTNNNSIEGTISQTAEKDLESSGKQTLQTEALSEPQPTQPMEPTVKDENLPSSDESDVVSTPPDDRDEHGQSMLHFACARSHGRNALIQLIEESGTNITYRDELYRTARDVALQATQPDNAKEIDRYLIGLVARGDLESLNRMLLEGYDHIVDVVAPDGVPILQVATDRGYQDIVRFLEGVRAFEENRENLLSAIRQKQYETVVNLTKLPDGAKLVRAKNYYGRCSLHIAILMENEDIVDYLTSSFKTTLKIGDNLERTPLHYAMGVSNVEALSRILIKNGAKRVLKDLKGRQPSYYFMNKADILRLQEEEKE